jgi:hypothetical protein
MAFMPGITGAGSHVGIVEYSSTMHIPSQTNFPRLSQLKVEWRGRQFLLPYLHREGKGGPCVFFVHGLGGAKENFLAAYQSPALADCTLLAFITILSRRSRRLANSSTPNIQMQPLNHARDQSARSAVSGMFQFDCPCPAPRHWPAFRSALT